MNLTLNRNIFQIMISSDSDPFREASPSFVLNGESLRAVHPDFDYCLLKRDDIESVLAADFGEDVQRAFATLLPFAYKADLARYCLLLRFGGIYADLSMRFLHPILAPPGKEMVCFRDAVSGGKGLWWVSNGLIRAPAGRKELQLAIDLIVKHCREGYYGASPLHPTGPALFGRALAMIDNESDMEVGEFRNFSSVTNPHSYGYLDGEGRLVAVRVKSRHLSDLGVKGTNHYADMWTRREIYKGMPRVFDFNNKTLYLRYDNRTKHGIVFDESMGGIIIFGPYVRLEAGRYLATFEIDDVEGEERILMDTYVLGKGIIGSSRQNKETGVLKLEFLLAEATENVEIRLLTEFGAKGTVRSMRIEDLD